MPTTIQLEIIGGGVEWPTLCACCGEHADTVTEIEFVKQAGHIQERAHYRFRHATHAGSIVEGFAHL